MEKPVRSAAKLPPAMTVTVLALLAGVYLLFFGAQAATLFSAFAGVRPEGLTYAEYARQGFLNSAGGDDQSGGVGRRAPVHREKGRNTGAPAGRVLGIALRGNPFC